MVSSAAVVTRTGAALPPPVVPLPAEAQPMSGPGPGGVLQSLPPVPAWPALPELGPPAPAFVVPPVPAWPALPEFEPPALAPAPPVPAPALLVPPTLTPPLPASGAAPALLAPPFSAPAPAPAAPPASETPPTPAFELMLPAAPPVPATVSFEPHAGDPTAATATKSAVLRQQR